MSWAALGQCVWFCGDVFWCWKLVKHPTHQTKPLWKTKTIPKHWLWLALIGLHGFKFSLGFVWYWFFESWIHQGLTANLFPPPASRPFSQVHYRRTPELFLIWGGSNLEPSGIKYNPSKWFIVGSLAGLSQSSKPRAHQKKEKRRAAYWSSDLQMCEVALFSLNNEKRTTYVH